jgi:hypothetical protein
MVKIKTEYKFSICTLGNAIVAGDALAIGHYTTLFVNKNSPPKLS